jgi:hypothetical protein
MTLEERAAYLHRESFEVATLCHTGGHEHLTEIRFRIERTIHEAKNCLKICEYQIARQKNLVPCEQATADFPQNFTEA